MYSLIEGFEAKYYNFKSLSLMNRPERKQKYPVPRSLRDQSRSRNLTCDVTNPSTTRKKFILEELPNSSETEDMRKIR